MFIDARLKRNALAYCDPLPKQRRRFIMLIYENLESQERRIRLNRILYDFYIDAEVEYLINPNTDELHRVARDYFERPHNLATAHLQNFIPCNNVCYPPVRPVHLFSDGEEVLLFPFQTRNLICTYRINKCRHCFPDEFSMNGARFRVSNQ